MRSGQICREDGVGLFRQKAGSVFLAELLNEAPIEARPARSVDPLDL